MTKIKLIIIAFLALVVTTFAGDQDFRLANAAQQDIEFVYISPSSSNNWGGDVLGRDVLEYGDVTEVTFPNSATSTYWDIKIVLSNGKQYTFNGLNLKRIFKAAFYFDSDSRQYKLHYEYVR